MVIIKHANLRGIPTCIYAGDDGHNMFAEIKYLVTLTILITTWMRQT